MRAASFVLAFAALVAAQTAKPEEFSVVEGRVTNSVTGDPVAKVAVRLIRTDAASAIENRTGTYFVSTDASGRYEIHNVVPGKYRLRATRTGFVELEYGTRKKGQRGTVLDLASAQSLNVAIRITPHAVITGRLLDEDGDPVEGAQLDLLQSKYVNGKKTLATILTDSTNDLGEYRWSGLVPGRYYIYALYFRSQAAATVAREEYAPIYYPGAMDVTGALPLDAAPGAQLRLPDIRFRKVRTVTVKGRVVGDMPGATGTPLVSFTRRMGHDSTGASIYRGESAKVSPAGEFEIRRLTPGSYSAFAQVPVSKTWLTSASTVLDLTGADVEGLVLRITGGFTISGRIVVEGDTVPDLSGIGLNLKREGTPQGATVLADDRSFREEDMKPGQYSFSLSGLPEGFYVRTIRLGDADVLYAGVAITSGPVGPVEIVLSPKAGRVSGVVQMGDPAKPAAGATVVMVPQEKERVEVALFYQVATTDQHGRFKFGNVPPGEYKVYAWEDVEATAWMDPEFMKTFDGKGEKVTVAESAQVNVQVKAIPAEEPR